MPPSTSPDNLPVRARRRDECTPEPPRPVKPPGWLLPGCLSIPWTGIEADPLCASDGLQDGAQDGAPVGPGDAPRDGPRAPAWAVRRLYAYLDARSVVDCSRWLRLREEAARWVGAAP